MNASREVKSVELPNCKLIKEIGKHLRGGSIIKYVSI